MEQYRDERIVCVGCGTSFLFSAAEAAIYAERGLAGPPKRCKDCRRARKEQRAREPQEARRGDHQPRSMNANARIGARPDHRGDARGRMPAHTGDADEYRSPMQDSFRPPHVGYSGGYGNSAPAHRGPPRGRTFHNDGNYRAPAFQDRQGRGAPNGSRARGGDDIGNSRPRSAPRAPAPVAAKAEPRVRPMFSITCNSCGVESQVPFKPDEGREVFCQACYRARKPS